MGTTDEWYFFLFKSTTKSSCTATYQPSQKLFKSDEQPMIVTVEEVSMNSEAMFSYRLQCWPTNKNLHQLCADNEYCLDDLPGVMDDNDDGWQKRIREH